MKLFIAACLLAVSLAQTGDGPRGDGDMSEGGRGRGGGRCVGEIDGMETRCEPLETQEECEADEVCGWRMRRDGNCVGEIDSMQPRCEVLDNREDCEDEGRSPMSDGVCDWIVDEEDESTEEPCLCFTIHDPVCVGRREYSNSCLAECDGHTEWTDGPCEARERGGSCVGEIDSMQPRCEVLENREDCEAEGRSPMSDGICDWIVDEEDESTEEPCLCFTIHDPVCVGRREYSNSCLAECDGHTEWTDGPCEGREDMCDVDEDCADTHWCRGSNEQSRCREYVGEGDSCNGNLHPDYHERCAEGLDCVYPDGLVGASGTCTRSDMCEVDEDCADTHWCRGLGESRCTEYVGEGGSCNGNLHPDYHERCAEGLDCVYPDTPGLVGASGTCTGSAECEDDDAGVADLAADNYPISNCEEAEIGCRKFPEIRALCPVTCGTCGCVNDDEAIIALAQENGHRIEGCDAVRGTQYCNNLLVRQHCQLTCDSCDS